MRIPYKLVNICENIATGRRERNVRCELKLFCHKLRRGSDKVRLRKLFREFTKNSKQVHRISDCSGEGLTISKNALPIFANCHGKFQR